MSAEMTLLINGSMIQAVDTLLWNRLGELWYIAFFMTPILMILVKTHNSGLVLILMVTTLLFYGSVVVSNIIGMPTIFTLGMAVCVAILIFKAFSPSN